MFGFGSAGMVGVIRWMVGLGCGESVGQVQMRRWGKSGQRPLLLWCLFVWPLVLDCLVSGACLFGLGCLFVWSLVLVCCVSWCLFVWSLVLVCLVSDAT
jgi:hypothetical protein